MENTTSSYDRNHNQRANKQKRNFPGISTVPIMKEIKRRQHIFPKRKHEITSSTAVSDLSETQVALIGVGATKHINTLKHLKRKTQTYEASQNKNNE